MNTPTAAINPLLISFPAAWEIVRRYRANQLTDLRRWIDAATGDVRLPDVWAAANDYLVEGPNTVADLSHWVMSDLPTGEARFIDAYSDVFWAAILLTLVHDPSGLERVRTIGEGVYSHRDRLWRVIDDLEQRSDVISRDLRVTDVTTKLRTLRSFLTQQISLYERRTRERILSARVSPHAVATFSHAARSAWRAGQPRALLEASGAIRRLSTARPPRSSRLAVYRLERKDLFIADGGYVDGTWEQIGRHFGDAFVRGESAALAARMPAPAQPGRPSRDVNTAITRAVGRLRRRGIEPTHILIPPSWTLRQALGLDHGPTFRTHASGLEVHEWIDCPPYYVFVLSLPSAIQVVQYVTDEEELMIDVREIGDPEEEELRRQGIEDVEGEEIDSPSERIRSRVWVRMHEYVRFVVRRREIARISLPNELRLG